MNCKFFFGGTCSTTSTAFASSRDSGLNTSFDSYSSSSTSSTKLKDEVKIDHCFDLSLIRKINATYASQENESEEENESLHMSSIRYGIKLQTALSLTSFDQEDTDSNHCKSLPSNNYSTNTYRNEVDSDFEDDDEQQVVEEEVDEAIHLLDEVIEDFEEDESSLYIDLRRSEQYGSKESLYSC
ncbi:unnamed protein product [Lepeophtheirus salmonis]|uniref:(salmon louse) hypothetical protein n=1 Tax=Lepeophtheirus salmonis TaxID=72036 RepID=A0A7R8CZ80_LEPSM|nr:unnamed protein product [Lepeophtheirus salmonis]CAF2930978.1 unnamed protein product [Lepeophtheirus salmonis]